MSDHIDILKKLHTRLIDSRDGYKSSREQVSDQASYLGFFDRRIAERETFHSQLHRQLTAEGVDLDDSGSVAASAHRGWLKLRDALTGDDEAVYDEIVNGEEALLENYRDAIQATAGKPGYDFLEQQRASVERAVAEAKSEKARHAA
ncbi:PA2169 family four-helix-bundle protein [Sulfitobacter aestuarii]|uniref:PA2169 family four-helix-bundle protein n=1 Tax=Sulfitobacter aestuarii TaxID=2161676 RepID=A0ABW5TYA0_9RHOB